MYRQINRWLAACGLILISVLATAPNVGAQAPVANVEGQWEGALDTGQGKLRLILDIAKAPSGALSGTLTSVDQGGVRIPIELVEIIGRQLRFDVKVINGNFDGTLSGDERRVAGTWTQGISLPLEFSRSSALKPPVNEKK